MQFEILSFVLERKKEIEEVRKALAEFKNDFPQVKLGKPKFGELSKKIIISFKVEKGYVEPFLTVFTHHFIKVLVTNNKIKKQVAEITSNYIEALTQQGNGWEQLKMEKPKMSVVELEEYAENGEYEEVLKVAEDLFNYGEYVVKKAEDILEISLEKAINNAISEAKQFPEKGGKSINDLIRIASNIKIKVYNKKEIILRSGLAAVEIAKNNPKLYFELIKISNNTHLNNLITVKAFIELGRIILKSPEKTEAEFNAAKKMLNLRWLEIAFQVVENDLEESERKTFNDFFIFLKKERNK